MNVTLDPKLVDYLHQHHRNTLTLSIIDDMYNFFNIRYSQYPVITYKVPKHMERYETYHFGDVTVYVQKNVKLEGDDLEFYDKKKWGLHHCYVRGIEYEKIDCTIPHL